MKNLINKIGKIAAEMAPRSTDKDIILQIRDALNKNGIYFFSTMTGLNVEKSYTNLNVEFSLVDLETGVQFKAGNYPGIAISSDEKSVYAAFSAAIEHALINVFLVPYAGLVKRTEIQETAEERASNVHQITPSPTPVKETTSAPAVVEVKQEDSWLVRAEKWLQDNEFNYEITSEGIFCRNAYEKRELLKEKTFKWEKDSKAFVLRFKKAA